MTELVPTETYGVVTIGFKTGRQIQFLARSCTVGSSVLSAQLREMKFEDAIHAPLWFELGNVEYVLFDQGIDEPASKEDEAV